MFALQVVVAIGIVLATMLVAGGRGDGLATAEMRRARTPLPADRELGVADLTAVRLGVGLRGYRMDEVDELLDRVALEVGRRDERIAELERMRTVAAARPPGESPGVRSDRHGVAADQSAFLAEQPSLLSEAQTDG